MSISVELDADSAKQVHELARKLKSLGDGKEIPAEFRKALRKGASPAVGKARDAALSLPSKQANPQLRQRIARAAGPTVAVGGDPRVGVRISRSGALGPQGGLPRLMNLGSWRHPVYGNDVWVNETSRAGWFDDAMKSIAPDVEREIAGTIDVFEKRLKV